MRIEYCPPRSPFSFSRWLLGGARRSPKATAWLSWSSFLRATRTKSDGQDLRACLVSRPLNRSSVPWSRNDTITQLSITDHVIRGKAQPAYGSFWEARLRQEPRPRDVSPHLGQSSELTFRSSG